MAASARPPIYAHLDYRTSCRKGHFSGREKEFWREHSAEHFKQVSLFFSLLWLMLAMWATSIDGRSVSHPDTREQQPQEPYGG